MAELLKQYESEIEQITLIPSSGGRFELKINGKLIYSKLEIHRHPNPGEIAELMDKVLREEL